MQNDRSVNPSNKWEMLPAGALAMERIAGEELTYARDVWRRFRRMPLALVGLALIALLLFAAIFGPMLSSHRFDEQNLTYVNIPPVFEATRVGDRYLLITSALKLIECDAGGHLLGALPETAMDAAGKQKTFDMGDAQIVLSYKLRPPRLLDMDGEPIETRVTMRNADYLLGTDMLGRDLLVRILVGARISLFIAFISVFVNLVIGVVYGGLSGYLGGRVDSVLMRIVEVISTVPFMLYVILLMTVLNSGLNSIVIALGVVYWVGMARTVRGQVLSLKQQEYVLAARTIGTSTKDILLRHLIPNTMGPIIVTITMMIPSAIFLEAALSFIGLGVAAPMASWGTLCNEALEGLRSVPYQLFFPALAICITMFAFNFLGDGLRDALDPRMRK